MNPEATHEWGYRTIESVSFSTKVTNPQSPQMGGKDVCWWYLESRCPNPYHDGVGCDCPLVENRASFYTFNPGFTLKNFTLQLFAYLGTRPTTFESDLPGTDIPIVKLDDGTRMPPDKVFNMGREMLDEKDWF